MPRELYNILAELRSLLEDKDEEESVFRTEKPKLKDMEDAVISFLQSSPNPSDDVVHDWAEDNNYNVHEIEAVFYRLATKYANLFKEGKAAEDGLTAEDVNPDQLATGIEVEKEHTNDKKLAAKIALDHLVESPSYYDKLAKMEAEIEAEREEKD